LSTILALLAFGCGEDQSRTNGDVKARGSGDASELGPDPQLEDTDGVAGDEDLGVLEDNEEASEEELAKACGGIDLDNPDAEVLNLGVDSLPIVRSGTEVLIGVIPIDYTINLSANLQINSTPEKSVAVTNINVVSANPALAQSKAEEGAAEQSGTIETGFVKVSDRGQLGDNFPDWKSITCVVSPAVSTTTTIGANSVQAEFDPPVPASISPIADPDRYDIEIGDQLTFNDINATVTQSTSPIVQAGNTYTGSVTIKKIAPTFTRTINGSTVTANGDIAFEVTTDFGSPEITLALGLKPIMRFYISHGSKTFKVIESDLLDGEIPTAFINGNAP
jgi:hypothetical protein